MTELRARDWNFQDGMMSEFRPFKLDGFYSVCEGLSLNKVLK